MKLPLLLFAVAMALLQGSTRFAATGDPNRPGLPHWQASGPDGIRPVDLAAGHACAFCNGR